MSSIPCKIDAKKVKGFMIVDIIGPMPYETTKQAAEIEVNALAVFDAISKSKGIVKKVFSGWKRKLDVRIPQYQILFRHAMINLEVLPQLLTGSDKMKGFVDILTDFNKKLCKERNKRIIRLDKDEYIRLLKKADLDRLPN